MGVSRNEPFGSRSEPGTKVIASVLQSPPGEVRRVGPVVFRILPHKFRAKAKLEGPSGNRALGAVLDQMRVRS
jgi:hypothetical protein